MQGDESRDTRQEYLKNTPTCLLQAEVSVLDLINDAVSSTLVRELRIVYSLTKATELYLSLFIRF